MALIFEGQICSLCGKPLDIDGDFFSTTALENATGDGCHPLSDAAFHWECILSHPQGASLIDLSFKAWDFFFEGNPYWTVLVRTDNVRVTTNSEVVRVEVREPHYSRDFPPLAWLEDFKNDIRNHSHDYLPPRLILALHAGLSEIEGLKLPAT